MLKVKTSVWGKKIYVFFNRKWFFDKIYNEYVGQFFFKFGYSISYKFIDRGIFEILGPTGLSNTAIIVGTKIHKLQSRHIYHYMLVILIGVTALIGIRELWYVDWYSYQFFILTFVLTFFVINYAEDKI